MHAHRTPLLVVLLAVVFPTLCCTGCGKGRTTYLVRDGASPYVIVTAVDAIPSEIHAAEELRGHIMLATGVDIPLVAGDDSRALTHPRIMIGRDAAGNSSGTP